MFFSYKWFQRASYLLENKLGNISISKEVEIFGSGFVVVANFVFVLWLLVDKTNLMIELVFTNLFNTILSFLEAICMFLLRDKLYLLPLIQN